MSLALQAVVLAAFEPDAGPIPGELTHFIERENLSESEPFPAGYRPPWLNSARGLLACATGVGAARAAATVMALGLDMRFDLSRATILVTGVAGADPERATLGAVVMPEFVVDGDLCHELDGREIPAEWLDGFVPIGKAVPYEQPLAHRFNGDDGIVYRLETAGAFERIKGVDLLDTEGVQRRRRLFGASGSPAVVRGDELSSSTFWHGSMLSARARRWVAYQTQGRGSYAITAMEDSGMLASLRLLAAAGRVDFSRVVIARGVSNFDRQRCGITAAESLAETRVATDSAYRPALENAWRVGTRLIEGTLPLP